MAPSGGVVTPPTFVRLAAHPVRWRLLAELADSDYRVHELVPGSTSPRTWSPITCGCCATAASSPPGAALRRPRQLLPPGSGPLRGCAGRQRDRAAPGAAPARDTADPAGRTAAVPKQRRAVRVHRQRRRSTIAEALLRHRTADHVTAASAEAGPSPTFTRTPSACCARSSASTSPAGALGIWAPWPGTRSTT